MPWNGRGRMVNVWKNNNHKNSRTHHWATQPYWVFKHKFTWCFYLEVTFFLSFSLIYLYFTLIEINVLIFLSLSLPEIPSIE